MKRILITARLSNDKNGIVFNFDKNWYDFFKEKKVNIISNSFFNFNRDKILDLKPNGVILTGGNDLFFLKKNKLNLLRDNYEKKMIKLCIQNKIPILGICKGFQSISKFFSGSKIIKCLNHVKTSHSLKVNKDSKYLKCKIININSFHNYGIKNINEQFLIVSKTNDNLIEIAEHKSKKILGIMGHPERPCKSKKELKKIVYEFFRI